MKPNVLPAPCLPYRELLRLALAADVDQRTLRGYLTGKPVRASSAERIRVAMAAAGVSLESAAAP